MKQKVAARQVSLARETIDEPKIAERAEREYRNLADEIEGDLPEFDRVFTAVRDFYRSLPLEKGEGYDINLSISRI